MARAAMPDGATGRAFGSSKKGMSSEKPDISPECSDSAAKGQKRLRFVLDPGRETHECDQDGPNRVHVSPIGFMCPRRNPPSLVERVQWAGESCILGQEHNAR